MDTLSNHLQCASQTWGQRLHQTMVIDYFFKKVCFFIWDEFKTGMNFLQIVVSYGLVLSVRKSISVTIRFCLLNLMGINQFLNYFGSKYIFENMWKGKTLSWVGLCKFPLWFWWMRIASLALKIIRENGIIHSCKFRNLPWVTNNNTLFKMQFFISSTCQMVDTVDLNSPLAVGLRGPLGNHRSISQVSWKHFIDFLYDSKILL